MHHFILVLREQLKASDINSGEIYTPVSSVQSYIQTPPFPLPHSLFWGCLTDNISKPKSTTKGIV